MDTGLLAQLEVHINGWINKNCESPHWPDTYIPETLVIQMARAAAAVFDANDEGQTFAKLDN